MTYPPTEEEKLSKSIGNVQSSVSLASDYRVDISSSQDFEEWSLVPITSVIVEDGPLAEGALASRALEMEYVDNNPGAAVTFKCTRDDDSNLVVTFNANVEDSQQLVATLSRIMVQHLASRQQDISKDYTVSFPNGESLRITNICEKAGVRKLFEPILDTTLDMVELVEMVDRQGTPLGMVPRPLVHTYNLLHRGIGMVVAKDASMDDLQSRTAFPALYVHRRTGTKRIFPSLYDMFVGGVSSAGEDATTTAAREVAEELGLSRALTNPAALSDPLFDCTVCTAYNRCVVTVFCFEFDSSQDSISWQEDEVAWGAFVPYSVIESSAKMCIERMVSSKTWPGEPPFALTLVTPDSSSVNVYESEEDWTTWDYVPDGLLVWEAWLRWKGRHDS